MAEERGEGEGMPRRGVGVGMGAEEGRRVENTDDEP